MIKVTVSAAGLELLQAAADYDELPLSLWLRTVGLKEARAVAHRKLCATVKGENYKWLGEPCTKEEFEEKSKHSKAINRD